MKTSEMIKKLQRLVEQYGDEEIVIDHYDDDGSGGYIFDIGYVAHNDELDGFGSEQRQNVISIGR